MEHADRILTCLNCHKPFVFSADEQEFFALKGYRNDPKRCKECQRIRHQQPQRNPIKETSVACANCGRQTTVPFVPRRNKPVLCIVCFEEQRRRPLGPQFVR